MLQLVLFLVVLCKHNIRARTKDNIYVCIVRLVQIVLYVQFHWQFIHKQAYLHITYLALDPWRGACSLALVGARPLLVSPDVPLVSARNNACHYQGRLFLPRSVQMPSLSCANRGRSRGRRWKGATPSPNRLIFTTFLRPGPL